MAEQPMFMGIPIVYVKVKDQPCMAFYPLTDETIDWAMDSVMYREAVPCGAD